MNNEQYLEYEDWQTLGKFYGLTVKTGDAVAVDIDGVKKVKYVKGTRKTAIKAPAINEFLALLANISKISFLLIKTRKKIISGTYNR